VCNKCVRRYGNAGAVWDIWSVPDAPLLRGYLEDHAEEFMHRGEQVKREEVGALVFFGCVCVCA
jgi:hypothetical protein